ncbi:glycosyltransferase family 2 protein [Myroides sp. 1354]|uniref:glycosyltransferase family 2 protein n=1 Tax=unclassified Myroides TaxID=2642485 RepID=UPI002574F338|nr:MULTISPECIES: glycosyltransferase family 2 protein [unclassified Myroides]MDM1045017.1 glycosyltransferase family 2 protein [Myroides sp. R163-1]MDM1055899.1 glycosyltransferase family 2 protein [Myroides sp. 1354]MDM1069152.1 glycosyltransferase family 2 protein [Myroides sp. 1372]
MEKQFALVVLNWNGKKLLETFLPAMVQYSSQANLYVIDNASTDGSQAFIQKAFPTVKIIENAGNYGYAKGYNEGLTHITEPILILINSDIEVTENWLTPIAALFESTPDLAIVQPKILDYKNKAYFEYAGAAGGYLDQYGFPYCRGRIFDTIEKDEGQYNDITTIFWASGACLFIKNDVFKALNGFDEDFFAHQEEIDLCWRAQNRGYRIQYCGLSTVYHVGGATLNYDNPRKTYLNFRNSLMMLYKNLPQHRKFSTLFIRLCLDGIAGVRFMLMGKPKHCWAIIRSHFAFYKRIPKLKNKIEFSNINNYFTEKSIIYSYFVCRKKNFVKIQNK